MSRISRFWNTHFLGVELCIAILVSCLFLSWIIFFNGSAIVDSVLNGNKGAIYGTLASVFGSLLGFVITALSIIIGYSTNEKFEFLKKSKHYITLWNVLIDTIKVLSLATVVMLLGLIFDRDTPPKFLIINANTSFILLSLIRFLIVFTTFLALLRLTRCVWILENIVKIIIGI